MQQVAKNCIIMHPGRRTTQHPLAIAHSVVIQWPSYQNEKIHADLGPYSIS